MKMKIGFLSNKLTLRGTEVNLYDYADFSETLLGHKAIIITRPYDHVRHVSPRDLHPQAYEKFNSRFPVEYYIQPSDVIQIVKKHAIDILYIEKAGSPSDGLVFNCCKTIIHCVFLSKEPHGTLYTTISDFVNRFSKTSYPVLPYMVRVHETTANMRDELGIPKDALVFGSYSGADEYNIQYVKDVVSKVSTDPKYDNIYFIYMNIDKFGPESSRLKFLPGTADMEQKRRFINTCDAMLYGRHNGETFGLACGEFSVCGKPVVGKRGEQGDFHETTLGEKFIGHSTFEECYEIVTNWDQFKKDVKGNGYEAFSPERVMLNFQKHLNQL